MQLNFEELDWYISIYSIMAKVSANSATQQKDLPPVLFHFHKLILTYCSIDTCASGLVYISTTGIVEPSNLVIISHIHMNLHVQYMGALPLCWTWQQETGWIWSSNALTNFKHLHTVYFMK
jgi:hypothetical protein